jgi:hypothetical protein
MKEKLVGKKARKKAETQDEEFDIQKELYGAWISMRTGLIVMALVSIGLGAWTAYQISYTRSIVESILWGLLFAGSIWLVFFGFMWFNRFLRRR